MHTSGAGVGVGGGVDGVSVGVGVDGGAGVVAAGRAVAKHKIASNLDAIAEIEQ